MKNPTVSVVTGSYNRLNFLKLALESVRSDVKNLSHEIIVVDGGSTDGSLEWLCQQKDIITIVQHNRGVWQGKKIERRSWGYFMNLAFKAAAGRYVCMISDDCVLVPGAIANGIKDFDNFLSQEKKIGALAFYWRDWSKDKKFHIGYTLGEKLYVNHGLFLKKALEDVDYIDEENFFFYNGDGDLCLKMWHQGYEVLPAENSYVEHYPHANIDVRKSNYEKFNQDLKFYLKKWQNIFYDPIKNNCGKVEEKIFEDQAETGNLFLQIHEQVIKKNPEVLKANGGLHHKLIKEAKWKYQAVKRKLLSILN